MVLPLCFLRFLSISALSETRLGRRIFNRGLVIQWLLPAVLISSTSEKPHDAMPKVKAPENQAVTGREPHTGSMERGAKTGL